MKLYELADQYEKLLNDIESGNIPEEAIGDTVEGLVGEINDKVDNIACLVKSLEADAKAIKEEVASMQARAKAKIATADRLRNYLEDQVKRLGGTMETPRNKIFFRKSSSVSIEDEEALIECCKQNNYTKAFTLKYEFAKDEIRKIINSGNEIAGASIVETARLQLK